RPGGSGARGRGSPYRADAARAPGGGRSGHGTGYGRRATGPAAPGRHAPGGVCGAATRWVASNTTASSATVCCVPGTWAEPLVRVNRPGDPPRAGPQTIEEDAMSESTRRAVVIRTALAGAAALLAQAVARVRPADAATSPGHPAERPAP